jgi:outer membrane receptor protein involved in Fe transport
MRVGRMAPWGGALPRLVGRPLSIVLCGMLGAVTTARAQAPASAPQNPAAVLELPTVEVIGTMPIPGLGVPREQVPANVQAVTDADLARSSSTNLPEFLAERLGSVHINNVQNNPFQPDVSFRGFAVSPLLGTPQGLSVFVDGVRLNEPFGDTVSWDLIPRNAIAAVNLLPGSNPVFGLNTLGGALALRTKSGETYPGTVAALQGGSFGRRSFEIEHGGARGPDGWFLAGNVFRDDGWRDFSSSSVNQLFLKLGREARDYDIDLVIAAADNRLNGVGFAPNNFLKERWASVYTHSDTTWSTPALVNLTASRWLGQSVLLAGNVYHRSARTRSEMLDLNQIGDARFGVVPFEGGPNDAAAGGTGTNVDSASLNRQWLRQRGTGLNMQASFVRDGTGTLTLGANLDSARADYRRAYTLGLFTEDRGGVATGIERDTVSLEGATSTRALFAIGTYRLAPLWTLTGSARYGQTRVATVDRLSPALPPPAAGLDNNFRYTRFNPALGIAHHPSRRFNFYFGASQGSRAPSPVELACADRNSPCLLPNAMASDPYLKQVVTRTIELGARGESAAGTRWSFALFRAVNLDDILFVSANNSQGYFTNFGKTRRQGLEAAIDAQSTRIEWGASYSLVDATFRSSAVIVAENNSARGTSPGAQDDEIVVSAGNRLSGVPRHQFKLRGEWRVHERLRIGATLIAYSRQFVRGNENNQHRAGTVTDNFGNTRTFHGAGTVPGYAVLNLRAVVDLRSRWQLVGAINNLFDKRYATAGVLGESAFPDGRFAADSDAWRRDTFHAPAAPRALFIGVRFADRPEREKNGR